MHLHQTEEEMPNRSGRTVDNLSSTSHINDSCNVINNMKFLKNLVYHQEIIFKTAPYIYTQKRLKYVIYMIYMV